MMPLDWAYLVIVVIESILGLVILTAGILTLLIYKPWNWLFYWTDVIGDKLVLWLLNFFGEEESNE